ncbi:hypothetical protein DL96DRAFT_1457106 [Flagelloscypha sp. PMI_526]|nr:hypothetical protein DL96DRAFT_1457106 [Flagelloscypha sp. PMI_526]
MVALCRLAESKPVDCGLHVRALFGPWFPDILTIFPNLSHFHTWAPKQHDGYNSIKPSLDALVVPRDYSVLKVEQTREKTVLGGWSDTFGDGEEVCYLVTPPLPSGTKKVHEVIFDIESHDQGWSNHHTEYNGVIWWLKDVESHRPVNLNDPPNPEAASRSLKSECVASDPGQQSRWYIVANRRATAQPTVHALKWTRSDHALSVHHLHSDWQATTGQQIGTTAPYGNFVRELKEGDRVAFIARAEYAGWRNYVRNASVRLVYEI